MQSYELAPLQQIDYQMNDAIRFEQTDRLRKIEDRKQRKLKKRKRRRRQQQQDDG